MSTVVPARAASPQQELARASARSASGQGSRARTRLLQVASELFYREGITRVGIDRVLREAGVTRATMYRHFSGKEALVAAYLRQEDAAIRAAFSGPDTDPARAIETMIDDIADDLERRHTRGCPFINAAAEYPDPVSDVRVIVRSHREWFVEAVRSRLQAAGVVDAAGTAARLVLLRDGALVGAYLDGPARTRSTFVAEARAAVRSEQR